jgi:hypothetical protein
VEGAFFRFPQSIQETWLADGSYPRRKYFRQGGTLLDNAKIESLAEKIVNNIKTRHASSGVFRSVEEFLAPDSVGGKSVLEKAIEEAGINSGVPFSSQYLTQADVMTALGPVLFARSDTFIVRAYGETLNPALAVTDANVVEGRAWCEAVVQRFPAPQDAADQANDARYKNPTGVFGRQFKIISFRWLNESDL